MPPARTGLSICRDGRLSRLKGAPLGEKGLIRLNRFNGLGTGEIVVGRFEVHSKRPRDGLFARGIGGDSKKELLSRRASGQVEDARLARSDGQRRRASIGYAEKTNKVRENTIHSGIGRGHFKSNGLSGVSNDLVSRRGEV